MIELMTVGASKPVLFSKGRLVYTQGFCHEAAAGDANTAGMIASILAGRHVRGDYGITCEADKALNTEAVESGARVVSKYRIPGMAKTRSGGVKRAGAIEVFVITEHDRSVTTVLLTSEY